MASVGEVAWRQESPLFIDSENRELNFKLIYWGAAESGKSTNIYTLLRRLAPQDEVKVAERPSEEPGRENRVLWPASRT